MSRTAAATGLEVWGAISAMIGIFWLADLPDKRSRNQKAHTLIEKIAAEASASGNSKIENLTEDLESTIFPERPEPQDE